MSQIETNNSALDRLISTVGELPASPSILSAVMGMTSNLDTRLDDLTEVLSSDVSLTAQVLKLSNSSFYGRSKEVTTLQEALPILGFFSLRSMVMASSAHTMFSDDNPNSTRSRLWKHSLASAVTARQIARSLKYHAVEEAFVAALLHDIGKLVLIQKFPERYEEVVKKVEESEKTFCEVETDEFGFSHCDVGAVLLEQWSFPPTLIMAVSDHHEPPAPSEEDPIPLAHLVCLGNQLSKHLKVGFNEVVETELAELASSKILELDEDSLKEILKLSKEHYQVEISILP